MGYIDDSIRKYVTDASAGSPTPGGGSVSALAGALGLTMGCMAANFTVGKKKYRDVEPLVKEQLATVEACREELLRLTDDDTKAYAEVSKAYGMPKETDEEKKARSAAIQEALTLPGVKVVLARQECAIQAVRYGRAAGTVRVDAEKCNLCRLCIIQTGCPAIDLGEEAVVIDPSLCDGCGLCVDVCNLDALLKEPVP